MIGRQFQVTNRSIGTGILLILLVAMIAGSGCIEGPLKKPVLAGIFP